MQRQYTILTNACQPPRTTAHCMDALPLLLHQTEDPSATDNDILDRGEFLVLVLDFGASNTAVFSPVESNPSLVALGVPTSESVGVANLATFAAARLTGSNPRFGFGAALSGITITVYNYVDRDPVLKGPTGSKPHLEFSVHPYSSIPLQLALQADSSPNPGIVAWDSTVACISLFAMAGSLDDGPIGEDSVSEQQNCPSPVCPAGRFGNVTGAVTIATKCPGQCPAGKFGGPSLTGKTTEAQACPNSCPLGKWGSVLGAASEAAGCPEDCPLGRYGGRTGATTVTAACALCAAGLYGSQAGQASETAGCDPCAAGLYGTTPGTVSALCSGECVAGTFSNAGASSCTPCPPGQTSDAGSSACSGCGEGQVGVGCPCPAGQFGEGGTSCEACPAGQFSDTAGASACDDCAAGRYGAQGAEACTGVCAPGQFSDAGASACTECPPGQTSGAEAAECSACEVGEVGAGCTPCSAGQFGAVPGSNDDCQPCAPGEFNEIPGETSCSECAPGQYSTGGAVSCIGCPAGQTSEAGATSCVVDAECVGDDSDGDGCERPHTPPPRLHTCTHDAHTHSGTSPRLWDGRGCCL